MFGKPVFFFAAMLLALLVSFQAHAACDQTDAPDCLCFDDTGDWEPGDPPSFIQDIADNTVGTKVSCNCTAPPAGCYENNCGKPYYQMVLGMNSEAGGLTAAYILSVLGDDAPYRERMAWCSETVSYWHREAGIPYRLGYRNDWNEEWIRTNLQDMRSWYELEEAAGGLARWIRSDEVDYDGAYGVTIPTPGAYMAYTLYYPHANSDGSGRWGDVNRYGHSLMIDELWVHKDAHDNIFKVEATFYEGNSGRRVKNSRPKMELFSNTVQGSQWLAFNPGADGVPGTADDNGTKIYGFGVSLDSSGDPIYDPARLHEVDHPYMRQVLARPVTVTDPAWSAIYLPVWNDLIDYVQALEGNDGPNIQCSSDDVQISGMPNGFDESWSFPSSLNSEVVTATIDFLKPYPLLTEGLTLYWDEAFVPYGYNVQFAKDGGNFEDAVLPDMSSFQPPQGSTEIPVAARLNSPMQNVRYARLIFPKNVFSQAATLTEMTIDRQPSPGDDSSEVEEVRSLFVDARPGNCPNLITKSDGKTLSVAILGTEETPAKAVDLSTVLLNGQAFTTTAVLYQDLATPFVGTAPGCHALGADGETDTILQYDMAEVFQGLDMQSRQGDDVPLTVSGNLNGNYDYQAFLGQDFIRLPRPQPYMLLLED